jgi:hypothetical protein
MPTGFTLRDGLRASAYIEPSWANDENEGANSVRHKSLSVLTFKKAITDITRLDSVCPYNFVVILKK